MVVALAASLKHFDEKLLRLKDLMNTSEGKRLAEGRHEYMQAFIVEINDEM